MPAPGADVPPPPLRAAGAAGLAPREAAPAAELSGIEAPPPRRSIAEVPEDRLDALAGPHGWPLPLTQGVDRVALVCGDLNSLPAALLFEDPAPLRTAMAGSVSRGVAPTVHSPSALVRASACCLVSASRLPSSMSMQRSKCRVSFVDHIEPLSP